MKFGRKSAGQASEWGRRQDKWQLPDPFEIMLAMWAGFAAFGLFEMFLTSA